MGVGCFNLKSWTLINYLQKLKSANFFFQTLHLSCPKGQRKNKATTTTKPLWRRNLRKGAELRRQHISNDERVSWVLGETKEYILSMASLKNTIRGKLENNYTVSPTLTYFVTVLECIKSDHFLKLAFSCTYIYTHTNT